MIEQWVIVHGDRGSKTSVGSPWLCGTCPANSVKRVEAAGAPSLSLKCIDDKTDNRERRREKWGEADVIATVGSTTMWRSVKGVTCADMRLLRACTTSGDYGAGTQSRGEIQ